MSIQLPPSDQQAAESLVAAGLFASVQDVVSAGIRQLASFEALRAKVEVGIQQADRGELTEHDVVFARLLATANELDAND